MPERAQTLIFFLNSPTDVVLREEFDNWTILFDAATGNAFGLNPAGVLLREGPGQVCGY
jgi:hypothetical protein